METNRKYDIHRVDEPVRLRYPLEDWIEQLLSEYPSELAPIRPERERQRSERLHRMQRGLRARAQRQRF